MTDCKIHLLRRTTQSASCTSQLAQWRNRPWEKLKQRSAAKINSTTLAQLTLISDANRRPPTAVQKLPENSKDYIEGRIIFFPNIAEEETVYRHQEHAPDRHISLYLPVSIPN